MTGGSGWARGLLRDEEWLGERVAFEQLTVYRHDTIPTLYASSVLTVGLGIFFWNHVSTGLLVLWMLYQLCVNLFRHLTISAFGKAVFGRTEVARWQWAIRVGVFLAGLGWGVGNLVLNAPVPTEHKILAACTLPAICGITVNVMSLLPSTYPVFMLPVMLPFLAVNLLPGTGLGFGLAVFGALFIVSLLTTSARIHASTANSMRISLQNVMLRELADEASKAKSDFLSSVSHELRTPMTSVYGFAKVIRKKIDRHLGPVAAEGDGKLTRAIEGINGDLDVIIAESERLTKLINDVLDLAKLDAGRVEMAFTEVDLGSVASHVAAAVSPLVASKGLNLILDVGEGVPPVLGERDRLVQVLLNLVSNSVKFTGEGSITVRIRARGGEVVVDVADTGIGIASENHAGVFEKFSQIGDTLTGKPTGTGLGLPICREIIERHGGRIWVESALGEGAVFSFALPGSPRPGASGNTPVKREEGGEA